MEQMAPEGMHAEDFFARKIRRLWPGANPRSWVPETDMLTTRPPKPLSLHGNQNQARTHNFHWGGGVINVTF
jgi:hypothetical protein